MLLQYRCCVLYVCIYFRSLFLFKSHHVLLRYQYYTGLYRQLMRNYLKRYEPEFLDTYAPSQRSV